MKKIGQLPERHESWSLQGAWGQPGTQPRLGHVTLLSVFPGALETKGWEGA